MKTYRIDVALSGFEGAKTGNQYHSTSGALIDAPEGEFKKLARDDYSLLQPESDRGDEASSDTTDDDSSSSNHS